MKTIFEMVIYDNKVIPICIGHSSRKLTNSDKSIPLGRFLLTLRASCPFSQTECAKTSGRPSTGLLAPRSSPQEACRCPKGHHSPFLSDRPRSAMGTAISHRICPRWPRHRVHTSLNMATAFFTFQSRAGRGRTQGIATILSRSFTEVGGVPCRCQSNAQPDRNATLVHPLTHQNWH